MNTMDKLAEDMKRLSYPANQEYYPSTISPAGVTIKRVELLEKNAPELFEGHDSLLDIGSSKGFISLYLANKFKEVDGYERSAEAHALAERVRQYHSIDNVHFHNRPFSLLPFDKYRRRCYDVVYAGSVHHHFFKDALLHSAPPWIGLKKMVALCNKYLIIDGPFEIGDDCSLNTWAKKYNWQPGQIKEFTFANHVKQLAPQFGLVRVNDNERGRQTAVFKRVAPDVPARALDDAAIEGLKAKGENVGGNPARPRLSIFKIGNDRYKIDRGVQTAGVFLILNYLSEYIMHTKFIIEKEGARAGDIAEWIDGPIIPDPDTLWLHWLRLNDILSLAGLIEVHFKHTDFKSKDGRVYDVDVDMIQNVEVLYANQNYMDRWMEEKKKVANKKFHADIELIRYNITDEFLFHKLLKKWGQPCGTTPWSRRQ